MLNKDLIEALRAARNEARLSQAALARKLRVSTASIGLYEVMARKVPLDLAERWAVACSKRLFFVLADPDKIPEGTLAPEDQRHLDRLRALDPGDRQLVEDFTRGLRGGNRALRDMIAAQIPFFLASSPPEPSPDP